MKNYKTGDYLSVEKEKLVIKNSKERLIKHAEKEIIEWQKFIKNLK